MSGTQFVCLGLLTWIGGLLLLLKMVFRPLTDKEYQRLRNRDVPWFWLDLFGADRTRENLTRFMRTSGIIGLAVWVALIVVAITFADWKAILLMKELQ